MGETASAAGAGYVESCLFCRLVHREVPSLVTFENDVAFGFLDRRPVFPGHCLLVPRFHRQTFADLPSDLMLGFFSAVQLLARAVEEGMQADGTFVAMNNKVSQAIPHLHVHIVPRRRKDGLRGFFWPRHSYSDEATARSVQEQIVGAVERLRRESEGELS